jgi:DNA-binding NarL/FixJ family response regulator
VNTPTRAGASALVGKDVPATEVVEAARRAHASPRVFAARDLNRILTDQRRATPGAEAPTLSRREQEVMVLAAEGLSAGAIARELNVAESTIKTHLSQIYGKLGATNRAQAVMRAVRSGLLPSTAPND